MVYSLVINRYRSCIKEPVHFVIGPISRLDETDLMIYQSRKTSRFYINILQPLFLTQRFRLIGTQATQLYDIVNLTMSFTTDISNYCGMNG